MIVNSPFECYGLTTTIGCAFVIRVVLPGGLGNARTSAFVIWTVRWTADATLGLLDSFEIRYWVDEKAMRETGR